MKGGSGIPWEWRGFMDVGDNRKRWGSWRRENKINPGDNWKATDVKWSNVGE